jgi:hypothetical protein
MHDAALWMQSFGQMEPVNLDDFENFLKEQTIVVE